MLPYLGNSASAGPIEQIFFLKKKKSYLDVVVHAYSPGTQEVKA